MYSDWHPLVVVSGTQLLSSTFQFHISISTVDIAGGADIDYQLPTWSPGAPPQIWQRFAGDQRAVLGTIGRGARGLVRAGDGG
jgi:hypothetical protein